MPELPEVETTKRGLTPHLEGRKVKLCEIRQRSLRWPVDADFARKIRGARIQRLDRRAKYLLVETDKGLAIWHLGMSGSLRIVDGNLPPEKHDHIDWLLDSGQRLRFHDPRRFGALLWTTDDIADHALIAHLGPEPLSEDFHGDYLYYASRGRRAPVKSFIMDGRIVVGVGNIYASEALFMASIRPQTPAGKISRPRYERLVEAIKTVLGHAIEQGGTTLRDFVGGDGKPGYFAQQLNVYGRAGQPCPRCPGTIREQIIGQRNTFFCPRCQR
ncbi:bifunctional DNA-formamidopyrimidine glycosylase/DNA-(apurinic or apyrimidinic site) lyase [Microbulbifer sp.]|uniref:bifunctional DNA-formamidopyrimidine glycosylase/DNA-(apurinic or apyrimidinic site) lyase n=1 Tax=Microbulbifer sp. TaxID=1908541 RepID=UPI002583E754|nr:bifunctional DNA-formamidopyrimidine glycosylase/DNA-(apurinic or apyrimidinic site) lyase [Microbulbifer sp.]